MSARLSSLTTEPATPASLSSQPGLEQSNKSDDYQEYLSQILALESIHKVINQEPKMLTNKSSMEFTKKKSRFLLSLRVVRDVRKNNKKSNSSKKSDYERNEFCNYNIDEGLVTVSNHGFSHTSMLQSINDNQRDQKSNSSVNDEQCNELNINNSDKEVGFPQSQITNTLSLLAAMQNKDMERNDTNSIPKLLLTFTDISNVFYECHLSYEELSKHRRDVSMDALTWKEYISYLHDALSHEDFEKNIQLNFEDEEQDLLKAIIFSPLDSNVTSGQYTSNKGAIKLKYSYELYAIRESTEFTSKINNLVFDMAIYSNILYHKRVFEDRSIIEHLSQELSKTREKLKYAEEKLKLIQPSTSAAAQGSSSSTHTSSKHSKSLGKRKAPKSLVNPTQKKVTRTRGAKIS